MWMRTLLLVLLLLTPTIAGAQVPDYHLTVETIARVSNLRTLEGCGAYTRAVVSALAPLDANFGHLRKPSWRTHVVDAAGNRHAADVILYRATGQVVDIARDCAGIDPGPSWTLGPVNEYDPNALIDGLPTWFTTTGTPTPGPTPDPSPGPAPIDLSGVYGRLDQLDTRVLDLYAQNERIFAYERAKLDTIEVLVVKVEAEVSTWRRVFNVIKDPRLIAIVGGLMAGKFAWPTSAPATPQ
jgi:hypothetical protein